MDSICEPSSRSRDHGSTNTAPLPQRYRRASPRYRTPSDVAAASPDVDVSRIRVLHANWTTFAYPLVPGTTYQFINLDAVKGWTQAGRSKVDNSQVFLSVAVCVADAESSCGSLPGSWSFIGAGSADGVVVAGNLTWGSVDASVTGYRCNSSPFSCEQTTIEIDGTFTAAGPAVHAASSTKYERQPGVWVIDRLQSWVAPATTALIITGFANLGTQEPGEQLLATYDRVSRVID